ncbi:MAG TPA: hypothetical protein VFL54_09970 [Gammaproteobacteria bacterium]|nr:hypothetical protein [Gammaproteobacteria bacterium]
MRNNVKTQSGNRLVVKLDGQQVGLAQSARTNDDYSPEPASGIGDIHVQEYVPTMARHTLNLAKMALIKTNLRARGLEPENGDAILKGNVFDIIVQSKDTGAVLRKYIGCSYASGDIEITKHQIVTTNAVFNCLDVKGAGL